MSLKAAAINSMNYFFLRIVTHRMDIEVVNEEVTLYLQHLSEEHGSLDDESRSAIQKELFEGEYFKGTPITEVRRLLDGATMFLTGEVMPEITRFYTDLLIEGHRLPAKEPVI